MTGWCAMRTGICRCRRRGVGRQIPVLIAVFAGADVGASAGPGQGEGGGVRVGRRPTGDPVSRTEAAVGRTGRQAGAAPGDKRGEEVETLRWDTTDSAAPVEAELPGDEGLELAGREGCPGLTAAVRASRWSAPSCSDRSGFKPFFERKTKTLKLEATAASRWSAP